MRAALLSPATAAGLTAACLALSLSGGCAPPREKEGMKTTAAHAAADDPRHTAVRELLEGMRGRLLRMQDVARWKWNAKRLTADPNREQALLDRLLAGGNVGDADRDLAGDFFLAQMQAAKQVQQEYFRRWEAEGHGRFAGVPDLNDVQRPRIDRISQELLAALVRARPYLHDADVRRALPAEARAVLQGEGITEQVRETALAPLLR